MRRFLVPLLFLILPAAAGASPIRANTSGTGVYQGNELVVGALAGEAAGESGTERLLSSFVELRYVPATHWVVGVRVPYAVQNRPELPGGGSESVSGWGDVVLTAKHRVFRAVGPWQDRHAAVQVGVKLPTGSTGSLGLLPLSMRGRFQPGTGSTDLLADAVYQQAHGRWGSAVDLGFRYNTEGNGGMRLGNEVRLNGSVQYVLLPAGSTPSQGTSCSFCWRGPRYASRTTAFAAPASRGPAAPSCCSLRVSSTWRPSSSSSTFRCSFR